MEKVLSSLQAFFFLLVFSKASLLYFIGLSLKTVVLVFPIKLFFCLLSLPAFWTMYIIIDSVWLFFSVLFLKLQNLTSEIFLPFSILSFLSVNFLSDIIVYVFFFLQSIDFCGGIVCLFFFFFFFGQNGSDDACQLQYGPTAVMEVAVCFSATKQPACLWMLVPAANVM